MQQRFSAAKLICQMFRPESCHASIVKQTEERTRGEETRSEPSWAPGGPSRGRLGRQEARPEAVLAAQEARPKAVLDARWLVRKPSWPSGGQNAGFTAVLLQNAGFAQLAVGLRLQTR